ncbi:MAG: PKD domain-containing protein [Candidatus Omnitrophica bacterium]|nr:PKD domain-containing protein [Candidatus Omnitrophota bacterium]
MDNQKRFLVCLIVSMFVFAGIITLMLTTLNTRSEEPIQNDIRLYYEYSMTWTDVKDGTSDFGDETGTLDMRMLEESNSSFFMNSTYYLPHWIKFFGSFPTNNETWNGEIMVDKSDFRFYKYVNWYGENMKTNQGTYPNNYEVKATIQEVDHDGDIWHWSATLSGTGQGSSTFNYDIDYWYNTKTQIIEHEIGHYTYSGSATTYSGSTTTWDYDDSWDFQYIDMSNKLPNATANVNKITGNAPLTVIFTGSGTDSDGTIASYYWDFGDGSNSTEQNPAHTYNNPGTYNIKFIVTDNKGGTGTSNVTVTVRLNQIPSATIEASINNGSAPLTVYFTGKGTDKDGVISSYHWEFGDTGTSDIINPSHIYKSPGTYKVTLTATDDSGATSTATITISVLEPSKDDSQNNLLLYIALIAGGVTVLIIVIILVVVLSRRKSKDNISKSNQNRQDNSDSDDFVGKEGEK